MGWSSATLPYYLFEPYLTSLSVFSPINGNNNTDRIEVLLGLRQYKWGAWYGARFITSTHYFSFYSITSMAEEYPISCGCVMIHLPSPTLLLIIFNFVNNSTFFSHASVYFFRVKPYKWDARSNDEHYKLLTHVIYHSFTKLNLLYVKGIYSALTNAAYYFKDLC